MTINVTASAWVPTGCSFTVSILIPGLIPANEAREPCFTETTKTPPLRSGMLPIVRPTSSFCAFLSSVMTVMCRLSSMLSSDASF